ncbi:hypothetical protein [Nocardia sp. NPDC050175]|uniref:hypothetical protein n=1 Tax=Nocardia sp. NPDC050175 TaxID=3364317 RepID=UPI0037B1B917
MGTGMRLDRVRSSALLAAIVLTAGCWVISAPTAQADPVGFCVKASKTYGDFKKCYEDCEQSSVGQSGGANNQGTGANNQGTNQVGSQAGSSGNQDGQTTNQAGSQTGNSGNQSGQTTNQKGNGGNQAGAGANQQGDDGANQQNSPQAPNTANSSTQQCA